MPFQLKQDHISLFQIKNKLETMTTYKRILPVMFAYPTSITERN